MPDLVEQAGFNVNKQKHLASKDALDLIAKMQEQSDEIKELIGKISELTAPPVEEDLEESTSYHCFSLLGDVNGALNAMQFFFQSIFVETLLEEMKGNKDVLNEN